jgi:hypothetical protein
MEGDSGRILIGAADHEHSSGTQSEKCVYVCVCVCVGVAIRKEMKSILSPASKQQTHYHA